MQGLRERKKARTRASLREHAIRLFRERGYQATTVEQIEAKCPAGKWSGAALARPCHSMSERRARTSK